MWRSMSDRSIRQELRSERRHRHRVACLRRPAQATRSERPMSRNRNSSRGGKRHRASRRFDRQAAWRHRTRNRSCARGKSPQSRNPRSDKERTGGSTVRRGRVAEGKCKISIARRTGKRGRTAPNAANFSNGVAEKYDCARDIARRVGGHRAPALGRSRAQGFAASLRRVGPRRRTKSKARSTPGDQPGPVVSDHYDWSRQC